MTPDAIRRQMEIRRAAGHETVLLPCETVEQLLMALEMLWYVNASDVMDAEATHEASEVLQ